MHKCDNCKDYYNAQMCTKSIFVVFAKNLKRRHFSNRIISFDLIESRLNISTLNDHVCASMLRIVFIFSQYVHRCLKIKGANENDFI